MQISSLLPKYRIISIMTVNVICQCGEFICDKCEYENRHNGEEHMTKEKLGIIEQADYFSETVLAFESKLNEEEKEINKERIEEMLRLML